MNRYIGTRDAPVPHEVLTKRAIEGKDHEGHDHDREDRVRSQYGEVDRTSQTCSLKPCGAVVVVIGEVRSKKK